MFVTIALIMDEYILWEREGRLGGREGGGLTMWPNVGDSVGLGSNNTEYTVSNNICMHNMYIINS